MKLSKNLELLEQDLLSGLITIEAPAFKSQFAGCIKQAKELELGTSIDENLVTPELLADFGFLEHDAMNKQIRTSMKNKDLIITFLPSGKVEWVFFKAAQLRIVMGTMVMQEVKNMYAFLYGEELTYNAGE